MSKKTVGLLITAAILAACTAALLIVVGVLLLKRPGIFSDPVCVVAAGTCVFIGGLIALLLVAVAGIGFYARRSTQKRETGKN